MAMGSYRNLSIEWLMCMHKQGYVIVLDADRQEMLDAVYEAA